MHEEYCRNTPFTGVGVGSRPRGPGRCGQGGLRGGACRARVPHMPAASPAYSLAWLPLGWEVMAAPVTCLLPVPAAVSIITAAEWGAQGQSPAGVSFILSSRDSLQDALRPTKIHVEVLTPAPANGTALGDSLQWRV